MLPSEFFTHPFGKDFVVKKLIGPDAPYIITHIPSGLWMESFVGLPLSHAIDMLLIEYLNLRDGNTRPTGMPGSRPALARAVG